MGRPRGPEAAALSPRFGQNLIELRARAGLSQTGAAVRAGLHRTEIALLERGLRVPRLDAVMKLAGAVEAPPCELLTGMAWNLERPKGGSS